MAFELGRCRLVALTLTISACASDEPLANTDAGLAAVADAAIVDDAGVTAPRQRVFITSSTYAASLAMLPNGVDQPCTDAAASAGLDGVWVAWLSVGAVAAPDRIKGPGPFVDLAGDVVFEGRDFSEPLTPLQMDENAELRRFVPAWTGTNATLLPSTNDCDEWRDATNARRGTIGLSAEGDGNWTQRSTFDCDDDARVFCFEQSE